MDISKILEAAKGIMGGMSGVSSGGDKKKGAAKKDIISDEMKTLYKRPMSSDNRSVKDVVNSAAKKSGVNPALLFSSAFQEGMNKAVVDPKGHSEAYDIAMEKDSNLKDYPVDAFYNYGVDKFGDNMDRIKKYLPKDFEQKYKIYDAINEQNEPVKTAAFKTNEDALIAKSAMMRDANDEVSQYAKDKGITLDDKANNYFTLARYNSKPENYRIMMDEYMKSKDKNAFIDQGLTSRKGVHQNIAPRMDRMKLADQLLNEQDEPLPVNSPQQIATGTR